MLLKISIYSCTKKLFQKTVENVKSFLSSGYQRLPKSPPRNSSGVEINLDKSKCGSENKAIKAKSNDAKASIQGLSPDDLIPKSTKDGLSKGEENEKRRKRRHGHSIPEMAKGQTGNYHMVARKLKELEMMDKGNVEHVLDIEEVLHHYSHLTCPSYRHIVDKFFMDMYSELFLTQASSCSNNFRPRLRTKK